MSKKRWALLSVADKSGIIEFATSLHNIGFDLLATGKTAIILREAKLPVTEVSELTGFPEILDGRVKTLHPTIHAGILARDAQDAKFLESFNIDLIELVAVNLYPFKETIAKPACTFEQAIEEIDIGGPTLLRAAAKNASRVTVICEPGDYQQVIQEYNSHNTTTEQLRRQLALKVFTHTAQYDSMISQYFDQQLHAQKEDLFPEKITLHLERVQTLRYGENPQQKAAFYSEVNHVGLAAAKLLQGKELSFNNLADASAALECITSFEEQAACVIVKHGNPCGVAIGNDELEAYERAFVADATSAFGGVIAINRFIDEKLAIKILQNQFVEVIVAPGATPKAIAVLNTKVALRIVIIPAWESLNREGFEFRSVIGGMLMQQRDKVVLEPSGMRCVTTTQVNSQQLIDLKFAWKVVKVVKSNAIVCAKEQQTIGIGAGQTSRVNSVHIALDKARQAGFDLRGSVIASDAFFPFADSILLLAQAGVSAIMQPGGSVRDQEVIDCANTHHIAMIFTGMRHFRH